MSFIPTPVVLAAQTNTSQNDLESIYISFSTYATTALGILAQSKSTTVKVHGAAMPPGSLTPSVG